MTSPWAVLAALPPSRLDPSPDRADELLRRELLRPEYHEQNLMERFLNWISDRLDDALATASQASPLGWAGAVVVFLVVLVLIGLLLSKARRTPRARTAPGAVLTEHRATAAELRRRAEEALSAGDPGQAVVEAFRALTVRQIERGRLPDLPGATAHEVATSLGSTYLDQRGRVDGAAALFDRVLYGDRPATTGQAEGVLALDDDLAGVR
ncbi:DUF4129 domain-containing protein [Nocardioides marmoriginsengisoli]|uniref:DUF4129 domain-containing protein n=1 Tax=Nocardioides marmoriginsengisoli TaxID=661483 RepID=A0A3N0CDS5_9ACTN|nr:DUF4129 domain-containing protein [Nocardioides marmoriginsengisoli]RNL61153.1 DUF4129 domain-containing protein [Nocardioides marmoriginsengisoli]